jgi:hypothetical protein
LEVSLARSTDRPDQWQLVLDDIQTWNQRTTQRLNTWNDETIAEFCAATTRLAVTAQSLLPQAVAPLLLFKEMILRTIRVLHQLLPGPAPTNDQLHEAGALVAGHLGLLREVVSAGAKEIPPRLAFDPQSQTVTLDGKEYAVADPRAFRVYRVIAEAQDPPVTNAEIQRAVRGLEGRKAVRRRLNLLPAALRATVRTTTKGHRWL